MIPDFNQFVNELWGWGDESAVSLGTSLGIVLGQNPPYSVADFLGFYPKFGGRPVRSSGELTAGSPEVTIGGSPPEDVDEFAAGQMVAGAGIPTGALIQSVDSDTQITLTLAATSSGTQTLKVYCRPLAPMSVINSYIALASASLIQARWAPPACANPPVPRPPDAWSIGIADFTAHWLTLYLRSDGNPHSTPGQAAAAGLAAGIKVSKGAGAVSVGIQPIQGLEDWGAWNETEYGVRYATMARCVGAGILLAW